MEAVNAVGENVWGGGFHNYARAPETPENPQRVAVEILAEAKAEIDDDYLNENDETARE